MKVRFTLTSKPGQIPVGQTIQLIKEPANAFDDEAIQVTSESLGTGHCYVAAYYKLRKPGTMSAGRLLDKIPDACEAVVVQDQVGEVEVA